MPIGKNPKSSARRKLLKVAALGASAAAALGCGGIATSEPTAHGIAVSDGGYVGRPAEEAGPAEDGAVGKTVEAGGVGFFPGEGGIDAGINTEDGGFVGDMTNDAGPILGTSVDDAGEE